MVNGDSGSNAGICADDPMAFPLHMCSGFPAERVEQMIMTSLDDITMITHAIEGGNI